MRRGVLHVIENFVYGIVDVSMQMKISKSAATSMWNKMPKSAATSNAYRGPFYLSANMEVS